MGGDERERPRETLTVTVPEEILDRLTAFCREYGVTADQVVERALEEYFREGDMSH